MSTISQFRHLAVEVNGGPRIRLPGDLVIPEHATGIVLFAHGSGSSRHSPRNQYVAGRLQAAGLATLLFDLLTAAEEREDDVTARLRFDIDLISHRLVAATLWLQAQPDLDRMRIGYFGASTGAAAALVAAAELPVDVRAVVSRGGRPDLAGKALPRVHSPTLLIVGGDDDYVLQLNRLALDELHCEKHLAVVPGASHLFEEPGTLDQAAALAAAWFGEHLDTSAA